MNKWRYFEFTIDSTEITLTPNEKPIRESVTESEALVSVSFSKGPEGTFIYRMVGSPDDIVPRLREQDTVIQVEASPSQQNHFGLMVHNKVSQDNLLYRLKHHPVILDTPIELQTGYLARFRITAPDEVIDVVYDHLKTEDGVRLEKIGYCRPAQNDPLQILTERQVEILQAAVKGGYYDIPRKMSTEDLGSMFNISSQVASEHIRKIEAKIIDQVSMRPSELASASTHTITEDMHS